MSHRNQFISPKFGDCFRKDGWGSINKNYLFVEDVEYDLHGDLISVTIRFFGENIKSKKNLDEWRGLIEGAEVAAFERYN